MPESSTGEDSRLTDLLKRREEPFIQNGPVSSIQPRHLCFTPNAVADGYDERILTQTHRDEEGNYHAMVLLAYEEDLEGNSWYLLQNWWPNMPLVLVTANYLRSCESTICFVTRKIEKNPNQQPTSFALVAQSLFQDGHDSRPPRRNQIIGGRR